MDKNRAVATLILVVFIVVISMLYVIFKSNRQQVVEMTDDTPVSGEEYAFDINNDISNSIADDTVNHLDESNVKAVELEKDSGNDVIKENKPIAKISTPEQKSPQTGVGSIAMILALISGMTVARIVYKKEAEI